MSDDLFRFVLVMWVVAFAATMAWAASLAGNRYKGAEVVEFEPSDQFVMPEAMGIDYVPEEERCEP